MKWIAIIGLCLQTMTHLHASVLNKTEAEGLFAHKVWPLIHSKCLACHGEDKQKAELDLRTLETALKGGESGPALVEGNAEKSLLYLAIQWEDEDLQMPPKENDRLTLSQIDYFNQWINAGAPWLSAEKIREQVQTTEDKWNLTKGVRMTTSGGLAEEWTNRPYKPKDLWAYQPLKNPQTYDSIDAFVNANLLKTGIKPAPLADRSTLIRRATFDLIGLPPQPNEVNDFVMDASSDEIAFEKVVERLLQSPHYGEQWGQHWLDIVRYADSSGFANDYERGNAWRYRDYVVRSFNQDKPYHQFIREQIAGDEMAPDNPEMLVAVGFLRMGPWELTGMEVAAIARQRFLDDAVNTVGQTFLGHTLRCAKCHDHKFDPIPTRDYYSLYSVFDATQPAERESAFLNNENLRGFKEKEYLIKRRDRAEKLLKGLNRKTAEAEQKWFTERGLTYKSRAQARKSGAPIEHVPPKGLGFSVEDFGLERVARKGKERTRWELERYQPVALSIYNGVTPNVRGFYAPTRVPEDPMKGGKRQQGHILTGGDAFSQGAKVLPGPLSVVNSMEPGLAEIQFPETVAGRRKALAEWVAHPGNPLTLRSIVNRIWQWHFNQPIAGNPNNLGATGKKPTHPELLDWLAVTFREKGWSIKEMHRLIMSSEAYRRSSNHPDPELLTAKDPNGTAYAIFNPRRMTSAELRDSMLAVSAELNRQIGGIPNRPEMNLEQALQPRMVMGTFAPAWQPNPNPHQRHRRSLYALKLRGLRDPFMEVFNDPNPDLSCEARDASTITPQVFSLFNSQISLDRAVAFANRLMKEAGKPRRAIIRAFQLAYGRPPTLQERKLCMSHYREMKNRHSEMRIPRPNYPTRIVRQAVEENTGESFEFTEELEMMVDFVPDKTLADVDVETRALAEVCLVLLNSNEFLYIY
ncbi:MAG TPA: DUF1549 domain-containing protein [Verrucomicrobiales bacterium]|nr:DUF1549 domain-containing protein [Verrucomicrobiales bacterium]